MFKITASRFVNVSEDEINLLKENAIPRNTKHAAKFGMTHLIDKRSTTVGREVVDSRSSADRPVICRSTVSGISVGQLSVAYRSTVGRISVVY